MYINKAEELMKKEHNIDLQSSTEVLQRQRANAALAAQNEPKGDLVTVSVKVPDRKQLDMNGNPIQVEVLSYVMRMGEKLPAFNFWPRGKEIIHRLIMRAATADSVDDFQLLQTDEEAIQSIIYDREATQSPRSGNW